MRLFSDKGCVATPLSFRRMDVETASGRTMNAKRYSGPPLDLLALTERTRHLEAELRSRSQAAAEERRRFAVWNCSLLPLTLTLHSHTIAWSQARCNPRAAR